MLAEQFSLFLDVVFEGTDAHRLHPLPNKKTVTRFS